MTNTTEVNGPGRSPRDSSALGPSPTVLFLDNSYTFGGAIISLARLVKGLDTLGVRSIVLSGQPKHTMDELFDGESCTVGDVPVPMHHETPTERLFGDLTEGLGLNGGFAQDLRAAEWHLTWTLPMAVRYARAGWRQDVDIVHLNNTLESQVEGVLAAKLLGIPCIVHSRAFVRFDRLSRMLSKAVDRFIAVSTHIEQQLLENGVAADRTSVVHDAVDTTEYAAPKDTARLREELDVPPEADVLGFLGRIVDWKGVEEFVRAAVRVLEREAETYALIVGDESDAEPSYFRRVRRIADRSSVADRFRFTGYRDDVPAVVQTLDVLVHTSTSPEPFGLVLVEAMAAGKPVVAADRGGPVDIVVEGETGYRVDPADTEALADSILRVLRDPARAQEMGRRGQERARTHFSIERYAREVREIYAQVLRGNGSTRPRSAFR